MKHLKRFNEDVNNLTKDIKEFTQECLLNLIDQRFDIEVKLFTLYNGDYIISLYKPLEFNKGLNSENITGFTWEEVKDDYISFIERLSKNYKIEYVYIEIWQHENVSMGNPTEKKFIRNTHLDVNTLEYKDITYNNNWGKYEPSIKPTIINVKIKPLRI